MEKIVVAFSDGGVNRELIDFACYICKLIDAPLTGVFIKAPQPQANFMIPDLNYMGSEDEPTYTHTGSNENFPTALPAEAKYFADACQTKNIRQEIQHISAAQLINDTRFFDLLVINPRTPGVPDLPSEQVKNIAEQAECPVLLAPASFREIEEIIHCYDGSRSSVFAIKQFTHLFSNLLELRCILIKINHGDDSTIENEFEMRNWLKMHYSQSDFNILQGSFDQTLSNYLEKRKNAFVVMGAYGRSQVSNILRESRANNVVRKFNIPVFISHV